MSRRKKISGDDLLNSYYVGKAYYEEHPASKGAEEYKSFESGTKITGDDLMNGYYAENSVTPTKSNRMSDPDYARRKAENDRAYVLNNLKYFQDKMNGTTKKKGFMPEGLADSASPTRSAYLDSKKLASDFNTSAAIMGMMSDETIQKSYNTLLNNQSLSLKNDIKNVAKYDDAINAYKAENDKREYKRKYEEQRDANEAYYEKRSQALENLTDEQRQLLTAYNNEKQVAQPTGLMIGGNQMASIQMSSVQNKQKIEEKLKESGLENYEELAKYQKELDDAAWTKKNEKDVKEIVEEHPIAGSAVITAGDILLSPFSGSMAAVESLGTPKDEPVNTNSPLYAVQNMSEATERNVNEKIDNPVGQFAYNTGVSVGKSALSAYMGGKATEAMGLTGKAAKVVGNIITLPQFGTSAYASTLKDDQEKGISKEKATQHAVAAGIGEMLFEVVSLDYIWDQARGTGSKAAKQMIIDTLVGAGIEGSEEGATDIWNRIADDIINGDKSDYNMNVQAYVQSGMSVKDAKKYASKDFYKDVAMDALAGSVSGGIMSGGANLYAKHNYNKLGEHVAQNEDLKNNVIETAKNMPEDTVARQLVEEKGAENLTPEDIGTMISNMEEVANTDSATTYKERFEKLGETSTQAKQDAKEITRALQMLENPKEGQLTELSKKLDENPNLNTVFHEVMSGKHVAVGNTVNAVYESYGDGQEAVKTQENVPESNPTRNVENTANAENSKVAPVQPKTRKKKTDYNPVANVTIPSTGEKAIVIEFSDIADNKVSVKMSDGSTRELGEIKLDNPVMQQMYTSAALTESKDAANAMLENYDGQDTAVYANASYVAYNVGRLGKGTFEGFKSNPRNAAMIAAVGDDAALWEMYTIGRNEYEAEQQEKKAKVAPVQLKKTAKKGTGTVTDNRSNKSDSRIVTIAAALAKKTGIDIELNDKLEHDARGTFAKGLSKIALSDTADNEYTALVHEMSEFASAYNPEGMQKVVGVVLDYVESKKGADYLTKSIDAYYKTYRQVEADKTYSDSAEEFVFDYISGMFASEEGVQQFCDFMNEENMTKKEQKGIIDTIVDFFDKLLETIHSYLDEHTLGAVARQAAGETGRNVEKIRKVVLNTWEKSVENYQQAADTESNEKTERYSIDVNLDEELKKYNIENKMNDYIAVQKAVVNHLKETGFFEKNGTIINEETGMEIRINPRGIKETLANGKRFQTLPKKLKQLKIATIEHLPEIIRQGKLIEDNVENMHGKNQTFAYFTTETKINGENYAIKTDIKKSIETNKFWMHNITIKKDTELLSPATTQVLNEIQNPSEVNLSRNKKKVNDELAEGEDVKYSVSSDNQGVRYSIDVNEKTFAEEYDKWDKKNFRKEFVFRNDSFALKKIGINTEKITFDGVKILRILKEHPQMTDEIMKKIPRVINDPVVILKSKQSNSRIVLSGELYDTKNKPVVVILELDVKGKRGVRLNEIKIASAYGKESMQNLINSSKIQYISKDKEKTNRWLKCTRLQLPFGLTSTGYMDSIASNNSIVNDKKQYSMNIDEDLMAALETEYEYSDEEKNSASIIEEGFKLLDNVEVNDKMIHKLAYDIRKEYKSGIEMEKLERNLKGVFAYLKDNSDNVNYEDMVRIVREIGKPVLEQSTDVDPLERQLYENARQALKGKKIRLSEQQKREVAHYYGDYETFRRANFGTITFSDKGILLDDMWSELCDNFYQMLEYDTPDADQPIMLVDALNSLRPTKKNIYGMDKEQASYDLALDIYRRFFVEQADIKANRKLTQKSLRLIERQQEYRKSVKAEYDNRLRKMKQREKDMRDVQAMRYEERIAELKQDFKAAQDYEDKNTQHKIRQLILANEKKLAKVKQDSSNRVLEIKAKNQQNLYNKRRNEELRSYRERIKKNAKGIIRDFNTNTDKRHIPETLKDSVAKFITSIDFVSERANPDSFATMEWQNSLNEMYRRLSSRETAAEAGMEEIYDALQDGFDGETQTSTVLRDMHRFIEKNSGTRITEMNIDTLKELDDIITGLKRAIAGMNQLYINERTTKVSELGNSTIEELKEKRDRKSRNKYVKAAENLLNVSMLDARSYFDRLGGSALSVYNELRDAFSNRVWMIKEAQEKMQDVLKDVDTTTWTGDKAEIHTFMVAGQKLKMTTGQVMALYELNKRNQARKHLRYGGIKPTDIGKGSKTIRRTEPVKLTQTDIDVITSKLTPEQRNVADAMQKFMSNDCAAWGNKTSMLMYGYERFRVKDYFPIKTDENSVDTKDQTKYFAAKKQGFTKETVKNAQNALIVGDIFDIFTNHVTDMATYSAYSAPLMDAMKWFNYRAMDYDGDVAINNGSVKEEMERAYGREAQEYFKKLIQDINGETSGGIDLQLFDIAVSNMKVASVGANIRVAIQQPTAYLRAAAVMDPKYLASAVFKKSAMKKAQEHSAITQWKSWGYFETSIGKSMKDVITGQQSWREKVNEATMKLAQLGDDVTWGYLWNACENEIKDTHKDVEYDSEEFLKLTAKRFDEVVDQTQVVDSVLHRSQFMRRQDGLAKMASSFMAEPTKSYNLLMNAVRDVQEGKGGAKKRLGRVVAAYTVTQVVNAMVVSFIDAMRGKEDDDKEYWERYVESLQENIVDNMNPLSMIPFLKDIVSIMQGYDVSRTDMQGITNLVAGAQAIEKYITDGEYREKHTLYSVVKKFIQGASQVIGIPGYNALRDFETLYNNVTGHYLGGIIRSDSRNAKLALDAIQQGDMDEYDRIINEMKEKGVADDKVTKDLWAEIKKRYLAGELTKNETEELLQKYIGKDEKDLYADLKNWEYKKNHPDASSVSVYSAFYDAIDHAKETGDIDDRDAIRAEIQELVNSGYFEKSDIAARVTGKYKQEYLNIQNGTERAAMKNLLISVFMMCGVSHSDALKRINSWEKE